MKKIIDAFHQIIGEYDNGNYHVTIYDDGTKIRKTKDDEFHPLFPESIDMNITYKCDGHCAYCYISSDENKQHCDFDKYKTLLDSIRPYTEVAINGNDLSHPGLYKFLKTMQDRNVIVNMTVHQKHFEKHYNAIKHLYDIGRIKGVGVSLYNATPDFIEKVKSIDNAVIHVVNGVTPYTMIEDLMGNNLKILILGYKEIGKGHEYLKIHGDLMEGYVDRMRAHIPELMKGFAVVSFDNLALEQLEVSRFFQAHEFDKLYMGDDGQFSFYIDLVNGTYSTSSLNIENDYKTFEIKETDTIDSMFDVIRGSL